VGLLPPCAPISSCLAPVARSPPPLAFFHHPGLLPYFYLPLLLCHCWLLMDNIWKHNHGYMLLSIASWQSINLSITIMSTVFTPHPYSIAELRSYFFRQALSSSNWALSSSCLHYLSSNFSSIPYIHPPLTLFLTWTVTRILTKSCYSFYSCLIIPTLPTIWT
jgi:hypothetical protein